MAKKKPPKNLSPGQLPSGSTSSSVPSTHGPLSESLPVAATVPPKGDFRSESVDYPNQSGDFTAQIDAPASVPASEVEILN